MIRQNHLTPLALLLPFVLVGCEALTAPASTPGTTATAGSSGNERTFEEPAGEYDVLGILKEEYREPRMKAGTAAALENGATAEDIEIVESWWDELGARWVATDLRTGDRYEGNASNKFKKVYLTPAPAGK